MPPNQKADDLPATLNDAVANLLYLLGKQGLPKRVVWVSCADVIRVRSGAYVRIRSIADQQHHAEAVYEHAAENGYAIAIEAWASDQTQTFAEVWGIRDNSEAQHWMMARGRVKCSVPAEKIEAIIIRNSLYWWYLRRKHASGWGKSLFHDAQGSIH